MAEVMIQEKEDAAAWLSTLHGGVNARSRCSKEDCCRGLFLWRNCGVIQFNCRMNGYKS